MVDAASSRLSPAFADAGGAPASGHGARRTASCRPWSEARDDYRRHCRDAVFAPPQSPQWVELWARHCNRDIVVAVIGSDDGDVIQVPLEIVTTGTVRQARFVGGTHANGNFPALAGGRDGVAPPDLASRLTRILRAARPDIDLLALERQTERLSGRHNPLAALPRRPSPDPSLAVDLAGGFDAVLSRTSGRRKRKKHRSQTRKFEKAGGFARIVGATDADARAMLDAFFAMKAARFAQMGIRDVFAETSVQAFFRDLFAAEAGTARPVFLMHGLEVAGRLRAITGSSLFGDRMTCEFGAIADDDMAFASPGEFLFFENIREACEDDFAVYDFSVGDEPYKRFWCDLETTLFDVRLPLTTRGRATALLLDGAGRAKRAIKSNRVLWGALKKLRRAPPPQPDEE